MEKRLTEKWMTFQANGWSIHREYISACHVCRVYAKNPKNGCELFLGQYEESLVSPTAIEAGSQNK